MSLSLLFVDASSLAAASSFATINQRKTNETNVSFMMMMRACWWECSSNTQNHKE
jgi:hypothetical protein